MTMHPIVATPILPSADFQRTAGFYETLGFKLLGQWDGEYLILSIGNLELHFFFAPSHEPASSDFMAYLRSPDTKALFSHYATLGHPLGCFGAPRIQGPPDEEGEFAVVDPDGTLLRIGKLN